MTAYVSGQAGRAISVQGDRLKILYLETPSEPLEYPMTAIEPLFMGATDIEAIERISEENLGSRLETKWRCDRALILTLMLLDRDEDSEIRMEACELVDGFLKIDVVLDFVRNRLFSKPMSEDGDLQGASQFAAHWGNVKCLIEDLMKSQDGISRCRDAWSKLPPELFDDEHNYSEAAAINVGAFYLASVGMVEKDPALLNDAKLKALLALKHVPKYRDIVREWLDPLAEVVGKRRSERLPFEPSEDDWPETRHHDRILVSDYEAYERSIAQVDEIKSLIRQTNLEKARRFTADLVKFQVGNDDKVFAAKSLCNLAKVAQDTFQFSFALELTQQSVEIAPEDSWSWCQLAEACIRLGRYDEARDALDRARLWGEPEYSANGLARILRDQGRLIEARDLLKDVIKKFRDSEEICYSIAELGRIYRELGNYEDAFKVFSDGLAQFPHESVLYSGLGTYLRETGKLLEALNNYRKGKELSQPSAEVTTGIPDTLKEMGELQDALIEFQFACKDFSEDPLPFRGRAITLRLLGRHGEALNLYRQMQEEFPFDFTGFRGVAEVYRELGKYLEAANAIKEAITRFPDDSLLRVREAHIYKEWGKFDHSLKLYSQVCESFPKFIMGPLGQADLLKELGHFDEALERFKEISHLMPRSIDTAVPIAAIHVAQGEYPKALNQLPDEAQKPRNRSEWIARHIRGMAYLKSGKIEAATRLFEHGATHVPFYLEKSYYRNALAVARLRQKRYEIALEGMDELDSPVSNVIRLHSYGALNNLSAAELAYTALKNKCPQNVVELRDELAAQLKFDHLEPKHDADWIFAQECNALTLEVTLSSSRAA